MPQRRTPRPSAEMAPAAQTFVMVPGGLQIHGAPTFEEWAGYGRNLTTIINASQWALGDWLNYGESRSDWGETWTQAIDGTQRSEDTLLSVMNVARKFAPERRRLNLSFTHHREVAALPESEQDRLLDLAERHGWNIQQLRLTVREERARLAAPRASSPSTSSDDAPTPQAPTQAQPTVCLAVTQCNDLVIIVGDEEAVQEVLNDRRWRIVPIAQEQSYEPNRARGQFYDVGAVFGVGVIGEDRRS